MASLSQQASVKSDRLFYVIAAGMMLILMAGGFRSFYMHGNAPWGITSRIFPLVVLHGLAMSGWVILLLVQSILILLGYRRIHMVVIGRVGAVLAPVIVILGAATAVFSVHFRPELSRPLGGPRIFLAMALMEMVLFATFVGIGLVYRRRPEIHRPMMLLATIVIQTATLTRLPYIQDFPSGPPLSFMGSTLLFGALLLLLQWGMNKAVNRWYLVGLAGITLATILTVAIGSSTFWKQMLGTFVP